MIKDLINSSLDFLTLVGGILVIFLALTLIYNKISGKKSFGKTLNYFSNNYLLFGFIVSLIATLGSLFYSEIMGYNPCLLCWYQRIFMYPQVFLFGVALWKKDNGIKKYILALSIPGILLSAYHYFEQIGVLASGSCEVIGYSSNCSEFFILNYGYITIPMMALTAFAMIIIFGIINRDKYLRLGA